MKKLIAILAISAVLLPAFAADFPKGSPDFSTKYGTAMAKAKESGKPLLVVFSASWCPPCQEMKRTVYPSKEIKPFHEKFEWVYLDVDNAENAKVAQEFKVQGIPHIQFVDTSGKALEQQVGGSSPKDFAKVLSGVLAKSGKTAAN